MMHPDSDEKRSTAILLVWPIVFGSALTLLRFAVLALFGVQEIDRSHAAGLLLGFPGQVAFALVIAAPLYWLQRSRLRYLVYLPLLGVVFLNVAAFHYEAVFWRLPGVSLLYYIREARHLSASAGVHAPWAAVAVEILATLVLLTIAAELLIRNTAVRQLLSRPRFHRVIAAFVLVCALFTFVVVAFPSLIPRSFLPGSRVPIVWALQSWGIRHSWTATPAAISREEVLEFQRKIGHPIPFGAVDQKYPLCGEGPRHPGRAGNGRSVIFLVLESVGTREIGRVYRGEPVMPWLRRIAEASASFQSIKASGSKSSQAMPALFAGIPPQPALHMLWRRPLNNVQGFPSILRQHGYRTAYIHGGDLSFEQQRPFLKMSGFEELYEYDVSEEHPFLAWGFSDDVAFRKLRSWIEEHRSSRRSPYLGTLFTLSTHDPYALPPERKPVFEGSGIDVQFIESLRFLDEQLGEFYQWYLDHEAPRGTVLVITGDHAPHLAGTTRLEDHQVTDFDVPLIVTGLEPSELSWPAGAARRGAQFDVPATILGAVDLSPGACDQGVDLLQRDPESLDERVLYSVAGDQLEEFHVWFPSAYVHLDQSTRTARVSLPGQTDPPSRDRADELKRRAIEFFELAGRISSYLARNDAFAPPLESAIVGRDTLPSVTRPRFISHRGQSRGEMPPLMQNSREAVEQALRDGFDWIELDVQQAADQVPVLVHDYAIIDEAGREHQVDSLTVDELRSITGREILTLQEALAEYGDRANLLIEIKTPQGDLREASLFTLRAAALVRNRPGSGEVVMDSFSPFVAQSLAQQCGCEVGLDAPYMKPLTRSWLEDTARAGMDWIYLHFRQASPELIRDAHGLGVRVLVYTVNEIEELSHLEGEWPDAVITDRADLVAAFDQRYQQ